MSQWKAYGRLVDLDTVNQQNHTSYDYSDYGETFWRMYEKRCKIEVVLPQSGNTLASYALKNPSDVSILDTYKELLDAADTIGKVVSDSDSQIKASGDETTVPLAYYWYQNTKTGELYTNNATWRSKTYSQLKEEYAENQDIPVFFYSRSEEGKNNIHVSDMLNKSSFTAHAEDFFLGYLDEAKWKFEHGIQSGYHKPESGGSTVSASGKLFWQRAASLRNVYWIQQCKDRGRTGCNRSGSDTDLSDLCTAAGRKKR